MEIRRKFNFIRNIIYFIAILISLTCLMFLFHDYSAQFPLKLILYVLSVQFLVFRLVARRMRISLISPDGQIIYQNGKVNMALFIHKRSVFPFKKVEVVIKYKSRYADDYKKKKLSIELKDGRKQWEEFEITGLCCGYNDFVIESIYLYDAFAFMGTKLKCRYNPITLVMMPQKKQTMINPAEIVRISIDTEEAFGAESGENGDNELYNIREFRAGDSMNRIHWKLSSKQEELMVREDNSLIDTNIYVFFDLCRSVDINVMFTEAVSISYELLSMGHPFYITYLEKKHDYGRYQFKRSLVTKYEEIEEKLLKLMEYPLYERDDENQFMLQKFVNEQNEIINLFII